MKVLVVGGGGREHALVWKIKQSPQVKKIFCAPGNAGISQLANCVAISAEDVSGLLDFACQEEIDFTVVGPEAPLAAGIVDVFQKAGRKIFGPEQKAATMESSKVLAKEFMARHGIPTAPFSVFSDPGEARVYIKKKGAPCVIKADGLAAGKGVIVAKDEKIALQAIEDIMEKQVFGLAGERIVIEDYLEGEEVSVLAFTDGLSIAPMPATQDHKRVFDGDEGPNTGGMGAYAPTPVYSPYIHKTVLKDILEPVVRGLAAEGKPYKGVLYAGLMITAQGPKTLEFNVRFGDPEAQPLLMLLETDLLEIIEAIFSDNLENVDIKWRDGAAVCVVLASKGYPGEYSKGEVIYGLESLPSGVEVFHAGTAFKENKFITAGGRVLGITVFARNIPEAIQLAYEGVKKVTFKGMHYRRDIGVSAVK